MPPEWHARAKELHALGLNQAEIGRQLGRSASAVSKALRPQAAKEYWRRDNADTARKRAKRAWERDHPRPYISVDRSEPDPLIPGLLPIRNQVGHIIDFARVDIDDWDWLRAHRFHFKAAGYVGTSGDQISTPPDPRPLQTGRHAPVRPHQPRQAGQQTRQPACCHRKRKLPKSRRQVRQGRMMTTMALSSVR